MIENLRKKVLPPIDVQISSVVVLLSPVNTSENGRVTKLSEFKPFDIAGSLAPFKSSDFSVVNLEQIGALAKLKTTYMSSLHDMNIADRFDNYSIPVDEHV